MDKPRYEALDGMRGIAAVCVMVMHATQYGVHSVFQNAYIAVDFFFILSGFVIAHAYGARVGLSFTDFMLRRLIRLYPLFLFGLILGAPVLLIATHFGFTDYSLTGSYSSLIVNAFYLPYLGGMATQGTFGDPIFPANPPAWSLFFEMIVNIFFLVLFIRRRYLWVVVIFAYLGIILSGFLVSITHGGGRFSPNAGWGFKDIFGGIPRVFYGFCLGIVLQQSINDRRLAAVRNAAQRIKNAPYFLFAIMLAVFMMPKAHNFSGAYYLAVIAIVAPLLVLFGSFTACRTKTSLAVSQCLGWLSYPLYCVHFPIISAMLILSKEGYGLGPVPLEVLSCLLSLIVAAISGAIYDKPIRAWLAKRFIDKSASWNIPASGQRQSSP